MQGRLLRIYLAHSPADTDAVTALYQRLKTAGYQPWLAEEDLLPGQDWRREIQRAVRQSDLVLLCLSRQAVSTGGQFHRDIRLALEASDEQPEGDLFLIPLRLDDCPVPDALTERHLTALDYGDDRSYERLKRTLDRRATELSLTEPVAASLPVNQSPSVSKSSTEWSFSQFSGLVERLLACPALANAGSRASLISMLPPRIQQAVPGSALADARQEVSGLLQTCLHFPDGLEKLLEIVRFQDAGTIPLQELERYLKTLV